MGVGTSYPSERRVYRDPSTGRSVEQLTDSPAHNYHLYFYNPSVTADGKYLIFYSERTGISNLFRLDLESGEIVQLTDARPARAEYWPFTSAVQGVGACLAAVGSGGREVFYFEGNSLMATEVDSCQSRQLLVVPADRRPSILHADAAGKTLVFATWDEALFAERSRRAFAGEVFPDDRFYQETTSTILRVDAATGRAQEVLRRENFWINHVLVNPYDRDLILFCHEWSGQPDRMWLLDVGSGRCAPIAGQEPDRWYLHEFWSHDGRRVCFHGGSLSDDSQGFCGWWQLADQQYHRSHHLTQGRSYAHYNLHRDGDCFVTDGEAYPGCISRVSLREDRQVFKPLCRHDSYRFGDDQRCHPHPSFTPDGRKVIFTSNRTGYSNVFMVDWE